MPQPRSRLSRESAAAVVVAVAFLLAGRAFANEGANGSRVADVPADMKFEPSWRERGDCGPLSLYALMRLCGFQTTIQEVKRVLPFDSDVGCSLADVALAAAALGLDADVRFVNAQAIPTVPRPFVLHATGSLQRGIGHFTVVVGYSPESRLYSVIDSDLGGTDLRTEDAVLRGYSGYLLVPEQAQYGWLRLILSAVLTCMGQVFSAIALSLHFARNRPIFSKPPRDVSAPNSAEWFDRDDLV